LWWASHPKNISQQNPTSGIPVRMEKQIELNWNTYYSNQKSNFHKQIPMRWMKMDDITSLILRVGWLRPLLWRNRPVFLPQSDLPMHEGGAT
jgi:hypothetical protein